MKRLPFDRQIDPSTNTILTNARCHGMAGLVMAAVLAQALERLELGLQWHELPSTWEGSYLA